MLHALNDKFSFAANGVIKYSSFLQHEILVDFSLLEQFLLDFNNSCYFLSFVRCFSFYIKTKSIQGLLFVQRRIEFMLDSFLWFKNIFTSICTLHSIPQKACCNYQRSKRNLYNTHSIFRLNNISESS
mmetsp:Transcript_18655/g.37853  ORF Transcript_18655/g.37853 Transcript_18655/m.37853 type:complete len:128 (+) Transcript_18655:247-630(+)